MKINTVKGTNDYLPTEAALRDYMSASIIETYKSFGYERIITPILEDAENLNKSEGGENLGLIFRILKRGDKMDKAIESGSFDELSDIGLRYDLTLPLSRYYANNRSKLLSPFKCIQVDRVYRAERPQKGRLREFVQCDIDIIGMSSCLAEVELIDATTKALFNLGIEDFIVRINDRRILKSILINLGYEVAQLEAVCIIIDKLDKIGAEGVLEELNRRELPSVSNNQLYSTINKGILTMEETREICGENEGINCLEEIMTYLERLSNNKYSLLFDFTLVRGQGYYTGTVFEISCPRFKGSIAGGGRYDNLIGKFLNENIPAVGFSIGFERIFSILQENKLVIPNRKERIAVLYEKKDFSDTVKPMLQTLLWIRTFIFIMKKMWIRNMILS